MARPKRRRRGKHPSEALSPEPGERPDEPEESGSVQDPLEDWAEDDADRWLQERAGDDIEQPRDPPDRRSSGR